MMTRRNGIAFRMDIVRLRSLIVAFKVLHEWTSLELMKHLNTSAHTIMMGHLQYVNAIILDRCVFIDIHDKVKRYFLFLVVLHNHLPIILIVILIRLFRCFWILWFITWSCCRCSFHFGFDLFDETFFMNITKYKCGELKQLLLLKSAFGEREPASVTSISCKLRFEWRMEGSNVLKAYLMHLNFKTLFICALMLFNIFTLGLIS